MILIIVAHGAAMVAAIAAHVVLVAYIVTHEPKR